MLPFFVRNFPTPIVITSKCLEVAACRYNGERIRTPFIAALQDHVELVPVCPEVEIGLGTPRDPIRLVVLSGTTHLVQPGSERDVTAEMHRFSSAFLGRLTAADGFILKGRSPSCGIRDAKTYSREGHPRAKGAGLFAAAVLDRFPLSAIEDEGRLTNARLRHHFLVKVFARAAFRRAQRRRSIAALVDFHTRHELQLMAYNRAALRAARRLIANARSLGAQEVLDAYERELARALTRPPRERSNVNALQQAAGYFSQDLTTSEKRHFQQTLGDYRANRVALTVPLTLIRSWIARFEQPYLATQTFLEPYPGGLVNLGDSGRG